MYKKLTREENNTYMSERDAVLTNGEILDIVTKGGGRVHFIGVGGVSMSSLFCLSRHFGVSCSGSDRAPSRITDALISLGENIVIGERSDLPTGTGLAVYSHAIESSHPEREYARAHGISEISRAQYLGAIMECYERRIGVSASHGKSTVTAMIAKIFSDSALMPTVLSGAPLFESELPFSIGSLDYLIYESCEYKDSFLSFSPTLALFLNMELDHTDYFKDIDALSSSFLAAMKRAERIIVNRDEDALFSLALKSGRRLISYGRDTGADYRYEVISDRARQLCFRLFKKEKELGEVTLPMLGSFNISNAVAAIAAAMECSIDFDVAARSLSSFSGIGRRLELIGEYKGRAVYYDYAHHPTEIRASVSAVREATSGKVTVIFRPHTYSRTAGLWDGFVDALGLADYRVILDIDAVRERENLSVSSSELARACGGIYCSREASVTDILDTTEGALILMGAADVENVKKLLTNRI